MAFGGSRSTRVSSALRTMDEDTRDGTRLLFDAYTESQDDEVLEVVRDFTARQREHLGEVLDSLPTDAHAAAEASLTLVSTRHLRPTQLLSVGPCGDTCPTAAPSAPVPGDPVPSVPTATPTYDDLGPVPCTCPEDPTATDQPAADPRPEPTPSPTTPSSAKPTSTPPATPPTTQPTSTRYPVPSQVPSTVASPVQDVVETVEPVLPTPLPTIPPLPGDTPKLPTALPVKP